MVVDEGRDGQEGRREEDGRDKRKAWLWRREEVGMGVEEGKGGHGGG